ncbi:hypothetical protein L873DRAFT_1831703 [Choiromyces venosus 120613-1]|uniref:Uncharacterized protein n=1 Tax=Choiromyces venosus 120613-1 TaxID=1336337 RepID=A0A3N4J9E2_9PEZI|nr:hypothetical protein L873DRAFT_1831703 [Choiromyces venosus 120613-1]
MTLPTPQPIVGIYFPVPTFPVRLPPKSRTRLLLPLTPPLYLDTQTSHALHLARSGITGFVLLERVAQIKHVRAALTVRGYEDCPLIAGAATNGIEETMELLNESAAAGAGQEGIIALYKGVAEGSSILVMMFVSPLLPPQDPALPVKQLPLSRPLDPEIDHSKFHLFIGLSQQLFPVLQVGCNGAIESLAAIFTKTVVHVYNLVAHTEATYRVSHAEELIVKFGTIGIKEAVAWVLSLESRMEGGYHLRGG